MFCSKLVMCLTDLINHICRIVVSVWMNMPEVEAVGMILYLWVYSENGKIKISFP